MNFWTDFISTMQKFDNLILILILFEFLSSQQRIVLIMTLKCWKVWKINNLKITATVSKQNKGITLIIILKTLNILNDYFLNKKVGVNFNEDFLYIFFEIVLIFFFWWSFQKLSLVLFNVKCVKMYLIEKCNRN